VTGLTNGFGDLDTRTRGITDEDVIASAASSRQWDFTREQGHYRSRDEASHISIVRTEQFAKPCNSKKWRMCRTSRRH
jgi:hypothetical protein